MNGLQLMDKIKETENKMMHLHKAIDKISNEPEFTESVSVLNLVVKDYQQQLEKMKEVLEKMNVSFGQQHQHHQQQQDRQTQELQ
ncbi:hypothetical protein ACAF76_011505 [Brevibacillus sp. TJ4]|uniref:hypothetical protein n=1 Tax=Brevibacillus sp. TJ4 TaxID=3234853 RepID=UPI0037DDC679